jgi:adenosylmethionine-8-amino-7-oxononanoate aminotransferase
VWLGAFRNLIYAIPPYICDSDDIATITAGMIAAARSQC